MNKEEKKTYVVEARVRLKKVVGEKLADIRSQITADISKMAECGGADAAESVLCALDCTYDQTVAALDSWEA